MELKPGKTYVCRDGTETTLQLGTSPHRTKLLQSDQNLFYDPEDIFCGHMVMGIAGYHNRLHPKDLVDVKQ